MPSLQAKLKVAEAGIPVGAAAIAAFAPLAIEQSLLSSPRSGRWPYTLMAAALAVAAFLSAYWLRQRIRHRGGSFYYVSVLPESMRDRAFDEVKRTFGPRFLHWHERRVPLPADPQSWRKPVDYLAQWLMHSSEQDDGGTRKVIMANCKWPVAWVLGSRLTHYWAVDVWQHPNVQHGVPAQRVVDLADLPRPDRRLVRTVSPESAPVDTATTVILVEFTGTLDPDPGVLQEIAGKHRLIRIQPVGENEESLVGRTFSAEQIPALVTATAAEIAEALHDAKRAFIMTRIPPGMPYALGALVNRDLVRAPEIRFIEHLDQEPKLTDLVIGGLAMG